MANRSIPSRHRIIGANTPKFVGQMVAAVGEVTAITPHANTLTLRLPDDENLIVLLPKNNSTTIEPNLLTEVTGKLLSRGQLEADRVQQWDQKATMKFNKSLYVEAIQVFDAFRGHYDI